MDAPICPVCEVNERELDTEPGGLPGPWYFSLCGRCTRLMGYRRHAHRFRGSAAQLKAGTYRSGHSWTTFQTMRPLFSEGEHVGYICSGHRPCGFTERFTAEDLEMCPEHDTVKGVCKWAIAHHAHRGEVRRADGSLTDLGRSIEREIVDSQVREDPGNAKMDKEIMNDDLLPLEDRRAAFRRHNQRSSGWLI